MAIDDYIRVLVNAELDRQLQNRGSAPVSSGVVFQPFQNSAQVMVGGVSRNARNPFQLATGQNGTVLSSGRDAVIIPEFFPPRKQPPVEQPLFEGGVRMAFFSSFNNESRVAFQDSDNSDVYVLREADTSASGVTRKLAFGGTKNLFAMVETLPTGSAFGTRVTVWDIGTVFSQGNPVPGTVGVFYLGNVKQLFLQTWTTTVSNPIEPIPTGKSLNVVVNSDTGSTTTVSDDIVFLKRVATQTIQDVFIFQSPSDKSANTASVITLWLDTITDTWNWPSLTLANPVPVSSSFKMSRVSQVGQPDFLLNTSEYPSTDRRMMGVAITSIKPSTGAFSYQYRVNYVARFDKFVFSPGLTPSGFGWVDGSTYNGDFKQPNDILFGVLVNFANVTLGDNGILQNAVCFCSSYLTQKIQITNFGYSVVERNPANTYTRVGIATKDAFTAYIYVSYSVSALLGLGSPQYFPAVSIWAKPIPQPSNAVVVPNPPPLPLPDHWEFWGIYATQLSGLVSPTLSQFQFVDLNGNLLSPSSFSDNDLLKLRPLNRTFLGSVYEYDSIGFQIRFRSINFSDGKVSTSVVQQGIKPQANTNFLSSLIVTSDAG